MNELSLHILDLVQNSISAGAQSVVIEIVLREGVMVIAITDDGCGMSAELLARVVSPFATTRTTRKVGLGIPMFKQCAEMCGGSFEISSTSGEGTRLIATFQRDHLDLPPMGDLPGTMSALAAAAPEKPDIRLIVGDLRGERFELDTARIKEVLDGVPLNEPSVLLWIQGYVKEGLAALDTGF